MKTLIALNRQWIFWIDRAGIYVLPVGGLFSFFLVFTQTLPLMACVVAVIGLSVSLGIIHHYCLYHFVKCPECGWNLTKFKNGENISPKHVYNAFKSGKPCLNCGWQPFGTPKQKQTSNQEQEEETPPPEE